MSVFYKLLNNQGNIEIISDNVLFYKLSKNSNILNKTPKILADFASINNQLYKIRGDISPEYPLYQLIKIDEEEYNILKAQFDLTPIKVSPYLKQTRKIKIEELKDICQEKIIKGCKIKLSDTKEYLFTFTLEDQANINRLMNQLLLSGESKILYHSTDNKVEYFTSKDFKKIFQGMNNHITYYTTYFNLLKNKINNLFTIEEINQLSYDNPSLTQEEVNLLRNLRK